MVQKRTNESDEMQGEHGKIFRFLYRLDFASDIQLKDLIK